MIRRCPICKGKHLLQNCPWRQHPQHNPFLEALVGGLGGGIGAAGAFQVVKSAFDKRSKKRNPISSISSNPITHTKMGVEEVLSHLKVSGYDLYDNYNSTDTAIRAAKNLEKQGYETKIVTVPVPLAKAPEAAYPNWVLRRRKRLSMNPMRLCRICGKPFRVLTSGSALYCPRCTAPPQPSKEKRGKPA